MAKEPKLPPKVKAAKAKASRTASQGRGKVSGKVNNRYQKEIKL